MLKGGGILRSEWIPKGEIQHILAALRPENRLACEISLFTGLRINDVLSLKADQVKNNRFTVREEKTGKTRRIYLPEELRRRAQALSGQHYVFEGRTNGRMHRTRQAVYKDLRRAAELFRCKKIITPHSMRKAFAVEEYQNSGSLKRVQKLLNHSSEAVTMIYAMANTIKRRKNTKNRNVDKKIKVL